jgi:hypothetical protein
MNLLQEKQKIYCYEECHAVTARRSGEGTRSLDET